MKVPVKVMLFITGIIFTMMILMALTSNAIRKNEIKKTLSKTVEQAFTQLVKNGELESKNYEELIAIFHQNLLLQINSDSDITVKVLTVDLEKGILDIIVTERYKTIRGKQSEVSCRKTILLETYVEEKGYHTITFLVDGKEYDKYTIYDGLNPIKPKDPKKEGYHFKYWSLKDTNEKADFTQIEVKADIVLVAEFE